MSHGIRVARRAMKEAWCVNIYNGRINLTMVSLEESEDGDFKTKTVVLESPEANSKFDKLLQQMDIDHHWFVGEGTPHFRTEELFDDYIPIDERKDLLKVLEVLETEYNALEGEEHLEPLMENLRRAVDLLIIPEQDYQAYKRGELTSDQVEDRALVGHLDRMNRTDENEIVRRLGID
jgi:hypothetical protein